MEYAYVGIDLAFAKRKRLPICICTLRDDQLIPQQLSKETLGHVPRGHGNRMCIDDSCIERFAEQVRTYLSLACSEAGWRIRRIAIDAPMAPRSDNAIRRESERALDAKGISCFTTPSNTELKKISNKVREHIAAGGTDSTFPHASQLWMFVGFILFRELKQEWECLEVYPQATIQALGAASISKRDKDGPITQLRALAKHTNWLISDDLEALRSLKNAVCAPAHDAVDAYSCAWIASLDEPYRIPLGRPPDDAIWIPRCS